MFDMKLLNTQRASVYTHTESALNIAGFVHACTKEKSKRKVVKAHVIQYKSSIFAQVMFVEQVRTKQ